MARPTKYRKEFNAQAYEQALAGATDRQLAALFEVNRDTILEWKKRYPEFYESIMLGKEQADAGVVQSLYQRALGFSTKIVKVTECNGKITTTTTDKYYPPNIAAITFWLRNRQADVWSSKPVYAPPAEERPRQIYKIGNTEVEF